jgi:predicted enzyme related to lactoylglutathione lyase
MNLSGILIGSEDPQRLAAYYTKLFGEPGWNEGGYVGWQIGSGYVSVGPHSEVHGANSEPGRILWNVETPNVKGEFDRLVEAGATVVQEPYNPSVEDAGDFSIATLSDPDGNYFQLMSPMTM